MDSIALCSPEVGIGRLLIPAHRFSAYKARVWFAGITDGQTIWIKKNRSATNRVVLTCSGNTILDQLNLINLILIQTDSNCVKVRLHCHVFFDTKLSMSSTKKDNEV